jgi:hypothetical protein
MRNISTSNKEISAQSFEKRRSKWRRQFLKRIYAQNNRKESFHQDEFHQGSFHSESGAQKSIPYLYNEYFDFGNL